MMRNLIAVVPVRKNSQRVKNKNLKSFAGKNLLVHKIEVLKKINQIDEIIINTDAEEAINIAKKLGVKHHRRENYFASSKCKNYEFHAHIADTTPSNYILFTNCTSPLVKQNTYIKIIKAFEDAKSKNDSINTVTDVKEFLYLNKKPMNFEPTKTPKSQDLPEVVKINFAVNIISTKVMQKRKTVIGKKPLFYKLDEIEGYDINTNFEFNYAEYLYETYSKL